MNVFELGTKNNILKIAYKLTILLIITILLSKMNESDKENKHLQKGNNRRIIGNYQLGLLFF